MDNQPQVENTKKPSVKWIVVILVILLGLAAAFYVIVFQLKITLPLFKLSDMPPVTKIGDKLDKKDAALIKFSSEADFKKYINEGKNLGSSYFGGFGSRSVMELTAPSMGVAQDSKMVAPVTQSIDRISETNVQVKGIDEPDILKTNGENLFYSSDNFYPGPIRPMVGISQKVYPDVIQQARTKIINTLPVDKLEVQGNIEKIGELLLHKDVLVVFSNKAIYGFDIKNTASPKEIWKIDIDKQARFTTARLYQDKIYLVTQTGIDFSRPCPITPLKSGLNSLTIVCPEVYHPLITIPVDVTYAAAVINPQDGKIEKSVSVVGSTNQSVIYMSNNSIYITYAQNIDQVKLMSGFLKNKGQDLLSAEVLQKIDDLMKLDISNQAKMAEISVILERYQSSLDDDARLKLQNEMQNRLKDYYKEHGREFEQTGIAKINLNDFKIAATGFFPGSLLNQFSLDEYKDHLRAATTIKNSQFDSSESANDVYVLDNGLNIIGSVLDLGKGERVYSARFLGDKGYVVTFKQTDPFYVLDLSNPKSPQLKGELKIPGYSSYLHPVAESRILGVGKEGQQVKISLFDVTNAENPLEIDKYTLDEYWSEALSTHHALLQDEKYQVIFIPGNKGGYVFSYAGDKLSLKKAVSETLAERAVYINDYLYIVGKEKIVVVDEKTWDTAGALAY